jgi:hypothetical protein
MPDRGRAISRYRIAKALLIYGLVALAAALPLFVLTWGGPTGYWALIYFFSGLLALAGATVLGVLNLIYLRQSAGDLHSSKDFE